MTHSWAHCIKVLFSHESAYTSLEITWRGTEGGKVVKGGDRQGRGRGSSKGREMGKEEGKRKVGSHGGKGEDEKRRKYG